MAKKRCKKCLKYEKCFEEILEMLQSYARGKTMGNEGAMIWWKIKEVMPDKMTQGEINNERFS